MKHFFTTAALFLAIVSASQAQTVKDKHPRPGSDRDAHGCKASAGYTFSALKRHCVRLFEQPVQLKEVNNRKSYNADAVVIFSDDNKRAEVFIPGTRSGVILLRTGRQGSFIWQKGDLSLLQRNGYILKQNGKTIFAGK